MSTATKTRFRALWLRWVAILSLSSLLLSLSTGPTSAIDFSTDDGGALKQPTASACPTADNVRPLEVWFNLNDMNRRGFADPGDQSPWPYMVKTAQVICAAADGATIRIGMFFIRALGTMTSETNLGSRPETDPEVIYKALEWVHKNRNVTVKIVLEAKPTPASAKAQIVKRLVTPGIATLVSCHYGCLNIAKYTTFPYSINHEKIIDIDHTVWGKVDSNAGSDDSAMLSSSGNWARSQTRNYWQESTLVYGDAGLHQLFSDRFDAMYQCAVNNCPSKTPFKGQQKNLVKQRGIWVDPIYNHGTSPDRGTFVSFAPAPTSMRDYYVQAFDKVDCTVQDRIRIAMFRMTDEASKKLLSAMTRLKSAGCSIKVILTTPVGGYSVSSYIKSRMKSAGIWLKCSPVPLHTKLVLIGSSTGNEAKIIVSTATMSVISLTQSDEHTTTFDSTRATGSYAESIRRAYGVYASGWDEIARQATNC